MNPKKRTLIFHAAVILIASSCSAPPKPESRPNTEVKRTVKRQPFGNLPDGRTAELFTLSNDAGMEATITNYGGIVTSLKVPDRNGKFDDVVLGFDSLDGYLKDPPYFGAIVGRYGNRIAKGRFWLNGKEYKLAVNNGENALHGGLAGFDKKLWTVKEATASTLDLVYTSPDGEEGYPGALMVNVTYKLTTENELRIDYDLTTDQDTVANVTNHSYFNLAGAGNGDILKHQIKIDAARFTPVDSGLIPTGELRPVKKTPFDFTSRTAIGARIDQAGDEQLKFGKGYDHNFVLYGEGGTLTPVAEVLEPASGRLMTVMSTEPGVQFYTGNFLDGTIKGKGGKTYGHRSGFCLETQHFPDSPNQKGFPSTVIKKGDHYRSTTIYRFSVAQ